MIFERYLFKNLLIATVFIAMTLAVVILLTQSLRFLELVINAGASGGAFWILTALALPRFFEVILPIALMAATVFIYNKTTIDNELTIMRAAGVSPLTLAYPALVLAALTAALLWLVTTWLAPTSLSGMHHLRQEIKAQYSTLLFREGVFNAVRPGLTVFIRARDNNGELRGLIIHDSRKKDMPPVTVLAKKGEIVNTNEGQQVVVYEGSRQDTNPQTGALNRLDFKRYSIDIPEEEGAIRQRWREPDERTFLELLRPDTKDKRDVESTREFFVEAHRRIVSPLLAPAYALIALAFLLTGSIDRRGQGLRISLSVAASVVIQGLYLGAFSFARNSNWGLLMMYILAVAPIALGLFLLSTYGERFGRRTARRNSGRATA